MNDSSGIIIYDEEKVEQAITLLYEAIKEINNIDEDLYTTISKIANSEGFSQILKKNKSFETTTLENHIAQCKEDLITVAKKIVEKTTIIKEYFGAPSTEKESLLKQLKNEPKIAETGEAIVTTKVQQKIAANQTETISMDEEIQNYEEIQDLYGPPPTEPQNPEIIQDLYGPPPAEPGTQDTPVVMNNEPQNPEIIQDLYGPPPAVPAEPGTQDTPTIINSEPKTYEPTQILYGPPTTAPGTENTPPAIPQTSETPQNYEIVQESIVQQPVVEQPKIIIQPEINETPVISQKITPEYTSIPNTGIEDAQDLMNRTDLGAIASIVGAGIAGIGYHLSQNIETEEEKEEREEKEEKETKKEKKNRKKEEIL